MSSATCEAGSPESRIRWEAAYHEAGHAVMAYRVGWSLRPPGVIIDGRRQYASILPDLDNWSPAQYAHVSLAGPAAEARWQGKEQLARSDEWRLLSVSAARQYLVSGCYDGDHARDGVQVAGMLLDFFPNEEDGAIANAIRKYEASTWAVISEPATWGAVERVADVLFAKGKLCPEEVTGLLPSPWV